jgi:hypothetical protein
MIHICRDPCVRAVAIITGIRAYDMTGILAHDWAVVMTTDTGGSKGRVVDPGG